MLSPYRALDLTDEQGWLCGKILGDLGADVIKVEPPGGDPGRRRGPFYGGTPHPERNLPWFAYNSNKRGITLDVETPSGQALFKRLVEGADFVIESFPSGHVEKFGLGYGVLSQVNPRLILTSITPFGQSGPCSRYRASDLEVMAMAGCISLAGEPDLPPVRPSLPQSPMWAGMHATMGTLIAHHHRQLTGEGQWVDLSAQASAISALAHAPTFWDMNQTIPRREGIYLTGRSITGAKMRTIWPCKDGYINFIIYGGPAGRKTNQALADWAASAGITNPFLQNMDWDTFDIATVTQEEIDQIEAVAATLFQGLTKAEFFDEVIKRDMLGYPVADVSDIAADEQLAARGFWQEVDHPELGTTLTYPGPFCRLPSSDPPIRRRAPLIGEHNPEVYRTELGLSQQELAKLQQAGVI